MADTIRHARSVSPWVIPNKGGVARDFHGMQNINGGSSVDSEDVYVVGKEDKCGTDKDIPTSTVSITQLERGEIGSFLTLANLDAEPSGGLTLGDFNSSLVDVILYEKENFNGVVQKSHWFPKLALDSITLDIPDPEARIERTFELSGDDELTLQYNTHKFLIHVENTAPSGTSGNYVINVSDPIPAEDPRTSGVYMLRIDRTRNGLTETLTLTTDYTYASGSQDITILDAETGDVFNIYYASTSFGSAGDPTTVDPAGTAGECFLDANNVTVLISDGTTEVELDLLTSLNISATLNRIDESVIGNDEKILKEVQDKTVDVALTGRVKETTIREAFMGQLGNDFGITAVSEFLDNVRVTVKIYDDSTKTNFLIGYQVDNLSFSDSAEDFTANDFGTADFSASSDNLLITTNEADLT